MAAVAVAWACALAGLAGWTFGLPALAGFGFRDYLMQPLTAPALLGLAGAALATARGARKTALALLAVPLGIAALTLFQDATGISLGSDAWLFADAVAPQARKDPGRPGAAVAIVLVLMALAIWLAPRPGRRWGLAVVALASAVVVMGATSLVAIPLAIGVPDPMLRYVVISLPTAVATVALALALLAWRGDEGWPALLVAEGVEGRVMRTILLLVLATPFATEAIQAWTERERILPHDAADLLETALNIVAMAAILLWSAARITREHRARRALTRALDSAPIALTDTEGRILHWSAGCEQLYGWSAGAAHGRRKYDLLRSEAPEGADRLAARMATQAAWEEEIVEHRADGSVLHVLEHARRLEPRHGGEPVFVLSMTDISDRTRAEAALRDSEARLKLAVEAARIGIFEWDIASGRLDVAPEIERWMEIPPGTIRTIDDWRARVDPGDAATVLRSLSDAGQAGSTRSAYRYRLRLPDGQTRMIEGSATLLYDADRQLERIVGVNLDVTERHQWEAALEAREAQLRSVLETVPDAMVIVDEAGAIRTFSAAAEQLFGFSADEVVGEPAALLVPEDVSAEGFIQRFLERGSRKGGAIRMRGRHRDGREMPLEIAVGEAQVGGERLFTGFVRDLTERLAAEARFGELQAELMHVSRLSAMGEMAAGLAHELNQPLAAAVNFLGAAELLLARGDADGAKIRELIEMANAQALRAGIIIRRLRAFVSRGEVQEQPEPVEEVVTDAVALARASLGQHEVAVRTVIDPSGETMLADRVQIQQVLVNLLRNAVEALSHQPVGDREIVIASDYRHDEGMIEISVSDNGPGLSDEAIGQLYKPFASTKKDGMGVGLSICRRIVEAHGGRFSAENRPEGGAVFCFTLQAFREAQFVE
ncbi:PAS domain S-box protein [Sphingosinicella sp. LY1275]|uniref:PAS domain-containing sensor histidine kinase n=1 Tax=Sphingosinicella sp. LY1275 TaxID=3095379 RepID=UPI002ADEC762|nr:PAS domain S-box protein [Sphingosinicella sp. LY1275]MEA1014177.1 PAS domain S-box protein [Sphingosinicella sp. LY1275]